MTNDRIPNLRLDDARIVFKNFRGEEGPFNREGDRGFAVIIPENAVEKLRADGWNIKKLKDREVDGEMEEGDYYLNVRVSYKNRPPQITVIGDKTKRRNKYGEDLVELLDYAYFLEADVLISPYKYEVRGETGISAYLNTMYVIIEENELDVKWSDVGPETEEE